MTNEFIDNQTRKIESHPVESQLDSVSRDELLLFSLAPYSLQILVFLGDAE